MSNKRQFEGEASYDGSKRAKTADGSDVPSRVLHVRGLPMNASEPELITLCQPFGTVEKILLLSAKQQAFVQMETVDAASMLVQRYNVAQPQLRGKPVHFQYSPRAEVKTSAGVATAGGYAGGSGGGSTEVPNHILIVTIQDARVPITIENIDTIFKPYGQVLKVIMFMKDGVLKALVQLSSVESAISAKTNLDGKNMFQGCCLLRIGYSKLKDLDVKKNGPRTRDFSLPDPGLSAVPGFPAQQFLIPTPGFGGQAAFGAGGQGAFGAQGGAQGFGAQGGFGFEKQAAFPAQGGSALGSILLVSNMVPERFNPDKLFILFGVYGDVMRVKILFNKHDTALIQMANPEQAHQALRQLQHLNLWGKELKISVSNKSEIALPRGEEKDVQLTKDYSTSPIHRFKHRADRNLKNLNPPSQVLHVSNLPETATEQQLRGLFGSEQSVAPVVSFFKNDRKMAYIKMESVQEAVSALMNLHNYKLNERFVRVSFSHKDPNSVVDSDSLSHEQQHEEIPMGHE